MKEIIRIQQMILRINLSTVSNSILETVNGERGERIERCVRLVIKMEVVIACVGGKNIDKDLRLLSRSKGIMMQRSFSRMSHL